MRDAVRGVVEVTAGVDGLWPLAGPRLLLEEEKLDLGVRVEGESEVGGAAERPLEHPAGIGIGR